MAYYNRDGEKLELKGKKRKFISNGMCGEVFQYKDFALKKYFEDTTMFSRLQPREFDILKNISSNNFIKLYEIYQKLTIRELEVYMDTKLGFAVDAYTSKFYEHDDTNIFTESTDYLLQNVRGLDSLFDAFSDNFIMVADMKYGNAIINENYIILTDPDTFSYVGDTYHKDTLKLVNKALLVDLIRSILSCQASKIHDISDWKKIEGIENNVESKMKDIVIKNDTDIAYEFSKKLKNVKRPIDYFSRKD